MLIEILYMILNQNDVVQLNSFHAVEHQVLGQCLYKAHYIQYQTIR